MALFLRSGVAAMAGRDEAARQLIDESIRALDAHDMPPYAAAARLRRGLRLGGDEGAGDVAAGNAWMGAQGIRAPHRLAVILVPDLLPPPG